MINVTIGNGQVPTVQRRLFLQVKNQDGSRPAAPQEENTFHLEQDNGGKITFPESFIKNSGRYFIPWNSLNVATPAVWLIFHGYGLLAKYFIRKFDVYEIGQQ